MLGRKCYLVMVVIFLSQGAVGQDVRDCTGAAHCRKTSLGEECCAEFCKRTKLDTTMCPAGSQIKISKGYIGCVEDSTQINNNTGCPRPQSVEEMEETQLEMMTDACNGKDVCEPDWNKKLTIQCSPKSQTANNARGYYTCAKPTISLTVLAVVVVAIIIVVAIVVLLVIYRLKRNQGD